MLYTVRVRGIYATALASLLHGKGFLLSDVSRVLQNRLPIIPSSRTPDVTVKSMERSPDHLLVVGYPWDAGEKVYNTLAGEIPYTVTRRGVLGLYTVIDAVSMGDCTLRAPGGVAVRLDSPECPAAGEVVRATVIREALEAGRDPVARRELRIVGHHLIVSKPGSGVSYSEHIRGEEDKARLLSTIQGKIDPGSMHVHFRSAAKLAEPPIIENELKSLLEELARIESTPPGKGERIVRRGEFIGVIGLPRPAKEYLDGIRGKITPTVGGHHSLKSFGDEASTLVDCAEAQLALGAGVKGWGIEYYLAKRSEGRIILVEHHKPDGQIVNLGRYRVEAVRLEGEQVVLELSKRIKTPGTLDGLGVEKRPGDTAKTRVKTGEWYMIHEYYTPSGNLLGVYANINTPIEIGPGRIKYFDLYIDVVKKPGEKPEVIDQDQLQQAREAGLIREDLYEKALETTDYLVRRLSSNYP